jgi:pentatricopeptide repeat protein
VTKNKITTNVIDGLGRSHYKNKDFDAAIPLFEEFLATVSEAQGLASFNVLGPMKTLAECYAKTGEMAKAEEIYDEILAQWPNVEHGHFEVVGQMEAIGKSLLDAKNYKKAEEYFRTSAEARNEYSLQRWQKYQSMTFLSLSLMGQAIVRPTDGARLDEAQQLLLAVIEGLDKGPKLTGKVKALKVKTATALVHLFVKRGDLKQAQKWKKMLDALQK